MFYFPMAGLSSRFKAAGYKKPKYCLEVGELSLFQASLKGFSRYFESDGFCFIYLEKFIDEQTIRNWAKEIGLPKSNCHTVPLVAPTNGQADTVRLGIEAAVGSNDTTEEVIIFNIDTIYYDFSKPDSGFTDYLDVTRLPGSQWSFVEPNLDKPEQARRVVEKERISDLCSVGLYGFHSSQNFIDCYVRFYGIDHVQKEEYVAPLYQQLIDDGLPVYYRELPRSQFDFLGTPQEYRSYLDVQKYA